MTEKMRVNRYLSRNGVCSRREADRMIEAGRVRIGGEIAVLGSVVGQSDEVFVDGVRVEAVNKDVVLAYNKPVGVICTTSDKERPNLNDAIDNGSRVFPIGRLDKDSSGLLLLTNNGLLADELMRSVNGHEKEYIVTTDKAMSTDIIRAMEQGVPLKERMTKPCRIRDIEDKSFHIILTEGMNRQIRRMCEYFGYRVIRLKRIRFATVALDDIAEGRYRILNDEMIEELKNDR